MYSEKHTLYPVFNNEEIGMNIIGHPEIKIDVCVIPYIREHLFGDKTSTVEFDFQKHQIEQNCNVVNFIINNLN